jgi:hypothetical protein
MSEIYCVPIEAIDYVWLKVEPFFKKAVNKHNAEFSLDDLKDFVSKGQWKLFAAIENDNVIGGAVVSFVSYPKSHVAFVTCMGGKGLVKTDNYKKFMELLKSYGADRIQGYVTNSVARLYEKVGVMRKSVMMEVCL